MYAAASEGDAAAGAEKAMPARRAMMASNTRRRVSHVVRAMSHYCCKEGKEILPADGMVRRMPVGFQS